MPPGSFRLGNLAHLSGTSPPMAFSDPEEHDETGAPDHGEHHDRATLLGAKAHSSSREKHTRFRVRMSGSRIFGALTLLSAVMLTINVIQIVLLERIVNSVFLLVGVPAIVFGLLILALLLWVLPHRTTLLETWQDASSKHIALTIESSILAHSIIESRRSAWIGNCLSILLPIILCEFVYMNSVAVPAFKTKVWSTSLQANYNLTAPSFAIHQQDRSVQVVFGDCVAYGPPVVNCSENIYTDASIGLVLSFNASASAVVLSQARGLAIPYNVSYNSSQGGYQGATWEFIVYDSHQDTNLIQQCDPIVSIWLSAAVSQHAIFLRQTTIADDVGAIIEVSRDCSADIYTHYNQYETSVQTLPMITGQEDQCDLGLPNYTGPCPAVLTMSYSSLLVTTLRSSHGTDWLKMLLEEGSIVGGIMFVTWFFNIFVT
ncbi:hypothetical protein LTR35_011128 [Friedmanniomyces endolithicus]|uniref:Transmembrane protein n=1 Tax=Friedmanniomyces endolithicus TaxID=329885 RepID=A0AAN6FVV0_9PEZI|nr:hypothetical protein LTR35_011128 [Friedmanniomyces endolithicus]KAK0277268.1 hypothetical protein LTS00_014241 [Friedmanniomyces endolithicus]KAK0323757.1 hypothetical protein LTR82_005504 [Friedmanniomyces endolithicus]KAK0977124.1 hypothetical protein LTR54_016285 [Friedmanniomyces endolithicus]